MIELRDLSKLYEKDGSSFLAVDRVNLRIEEGDIYGIIGYSGAGKSSLLRCMNLLERPSSGQVIFDGRDITDYGPRELRRTRREIGMIFQNFNLFESRNVYENIAYPLRGLGQEEKASRVRELLSLVELEDKAGSYPSELSGGQKQRVAIARALANRPKVLLCDEATSALDPKTTDSILSLLKKLNESFKLTIVIITHEMDLVKRICNRISIMSQGKIIEDGGLLDVFTDPASLETRDFLEPRKQDLDLKNILGLYLGANRSYARISYVGDLAGQAFISRASRIFNIDISILFGQIEILDGTPLGQLIVGLRGEDQALVQALEYFRKNGIEVEVIEDELLS